MNSNNKEPEHNGSEKTCAYHSLRWFLRFLRVVASVALIANVIFYILSIKGSVENKNFGAYEKSFIVLSGIGFIALCAMEVLGEIGAKWFLRRVIFMKIMVIRGFLMVWQGVQAIDNVGSEAGKSVTDIDKTTFRLMGDVIGWVLIGCGCVFILVSTFQVKRIVGLHESSSVVEQGSASSVTLPKDPNDRERTKLPASGSSVLSTEARCVISNMAIALDMTSSRAWDLFNGPAGAEEGRRIRAERAQSLAAAANCEEKPSREFRAQPSLPDEKKYLCSETPKSYSPVENSDTSPILEPRKARLADDDAALAAQYYGSATK